MSSPRVLAVDCGAGHVACGLLQSDKSGRLSLERFAIETFNPDAALENKWSQLLTQSLGELVQREKLGGPAVIGLPGHHTLSKFIKTPAVEKSKRAKIFQFEAQQNIPYPLGEVVWDHLTVADDGLDLEVMLGAAKIDVVDGVCAAVGDAGLSVQAVSSSSVALLRCFRYNYPEVTDSVLVVDIGARSTNLLFVENQRFFIRTIQSLAGNTITQSIAEEIKQDFAHSESLKVQVLSGSSELPANSPARAAVANAVQSFISRLQLEVTRSTVNYRRQSGAEQPVSVYLSGGGSLIDNIAAQLGERLKMPVERLDPLRNVSVGAGAAEARECQVVLAGMIGLAVPPVKGEDTFSLLPPAIASQQAFRRRQPMLIAAAALTALIFIPPLLQSQRLLAAYKAEAAAYKRATEPLRQTQSANEQNRAQIQKAREQVEAIRSLVESKANWINFLTDLQDRLSSVGDVWLDQLSVQRAATATASSSGAPFGRAAPRSGQDDETKAPEVIRLQVSGRLLDINNPVSKVTQDSYERVKSLLESFVGSRFISAVESERFNADQAGILRFDFILVVDPQRPL